MHEYASIDIYAQTYTCRYTDIQTTFLKNFYKFSLSRKIDKSLGQNRKEQTECVHFLFKQGIRSG